MNERGFRKNFVMRCKSEKKNENEKENEKENENEEKSQISIN